MTDFLKVNCKQYSHTDPEVVWINPDRIIFITWNPDFCWRMEPVRINGAWLIQFETGALYSFFHPFGPEIGRPDRRNIEPSSEGQT